MFGRLCRLLEDYVIKLSVWPRKGRSVFRDLEGSLEKDLAVFGRVLSLFFDCSDPLSCHFAGLDMRRVEMKIYLGLQHCSRRKKRFQPVTLHSFLLNFQRHSYALLHPDLRTVKTSSSHRAVTSLSCIHIFSSSHYLITPPRYILIRVFKPPTLF